MNGLLFLANADFRVQKGIKGDVMCHSIPGISLILFYSNQCGYCKNLIPIFRNLPGSIGGCQFGMVNVGLNKEAVVMSKKTIAPITYVPYIVLYVNGVPFMSYKGPHDLVEIKRFVFEVGQSVQSKTQFVNPNVKKGIRDSIPEYTIGRPLYGEDDKVCYLEFGTAYKK